MRFVILINFIFIFFVSISYGGNKDKTISEYGWPLIQNFNEQDYKMSSAIWCITCH